MAGRVTDSQGVDGNQHRTNAWMPDTANVQKIATENATTAFTRDQLVRCVCDADSHLNFHPSTAADTSDMFMPDNHVEYFIVKKGDKIAVIGGNLYVTPVL